MKYTWILEDSVILYPNHIHTEEMLTTIIYYSVLIMLYYMKVLVPGVSF